MKSRATLIGLALIALSASEARSQSVAQIVGNDVKYAAQDFAAIWTSPLRGTGKDYLIVAGVLGAAALVSPFDDDVDRWAIRNRDTGVLDAIRPFRRGGALYSINELTPYVAGLYVVGVATKHEGIRDGIFGCVAAYGANTTIRHQVLFRLIGRDRPEPIKNVGDGTPTPPAQHGDQYDFTIPSEGWGQHSFPGGHVATMATCASFLSHRFDMGLVEPALAGLVAVMGVGRLADRGHWLSDQIVGTAFGFAIGREVARRQLKRKAQREAPTVEASTPGMTSAPFIGTDANGTRVGWQVTF
ncbi:MAG: phosphatase PAP2 family protein [Gemmatimonadaceae bacterium]|nr:phosphatase PAP2 family protein [Gemmatimonadaceae bacterium]